MKKLKDDLVDHMKEIIKILIVKIKRIEIVFITVNQSFGPQVDSVAGENHSLFLSQDGTVVGNGDNRNGQINIPKSLEGKIKMVAAGGQHSLMLSNSGHVQTCGMNHRGQCDVDKIFPPVQGNVRQVSAGTYHSLIVTNDNQLYTLGRNYHKECSIPEEAQGIVLSACAGFKHTLILTLDGYVQATGDNSCGQCKIPFEVQDSGNVKDISAGEQHSVQLTNEGQVQISGRDVDGQCQVPQFRDQAGDNIQGHVQAISAGGCHTLFLLDSGKAIGSGKNAFGQLDIDNSHIDEKAIDTPFDIGKQKHGHWSRKIVSISAGHNHSLVLQNDGVVKGYGRKNEHQVFMPNGKFNFADQFKDNFIKLPKYDKDMAELNEINNIRKKIEQHQLKQKQKTNSNQNKQEIGKYIQQQKQPWSKDNINGYNFKINDKFRLNTKGSEEERPETRDQTRRVRNIFRKETVVTSEISRIRKLQQDKLKKLSMNYKFGNI